MEVVRRGTEAGRGEHGAPMSAGGSRGDEEEEGDIEAGVMGLAVAEEGFPLAEAVVGGRTAGTGEGRQWALARRDTKGASKEMLVPHDVFYVTIVLSDTADVRLSQEYAVETIRTFRSMSVMATRV